jgi:hypothetical protein
VREYDVSLPSHTVHVLEQPGALADAVLSFVA